MKTLSIENPRSPHYGKELEIPESVDEALDILARHNRAAREIPLGIEVFRILKAAAPTDARAYRAMVVETLERIESAVTGKEIVMFKYVTPRAVARPVIHVAEAASIGEGFEKTLCGTLHDEHRWLVRASLPVGNYDACAVCFTLLQARPLAGKAQ